MSIAVEPCPEGVELSFTLPKGAYATVILRELLKSDIHEPEEAS
jgi:tRNA pseudouridine13 synthase